VCGREYEAKRKDSLTCSATCRSNKRNAKAAPPPVENSLVAATRRELEAAGKVDTMLGQLALSLAGRMNGVLTGHASLSKELRLVTAAAVGAVATTGDGPVVDVVDEVRARRDAKRAG
jgi:hypothetical protein